MRAPKDDVILRGTVKAYITEVRVRYTGMCIYVRHSVGVWFAGPDSRIGTVPGGGGHQRMGLLVKPRLRFWG